MNRRQATIVSCSYGGCKFIAEVRDPNEAPEGWYLITPATEDQKMGHAYTRNESFEFHSLRCVERWANERRRYFADQPPPQVERLEGEPEPEPVPAGLRPLAGSHLSEDDLVAACKLLSENGTSQFTVGQVAVVLERPKGTIKGRMKRMVEQGQIVKVGTVQGTPGSPAVLYSLVGSLNGDGHDD
jgi:hypothetical protein